MGKGHKKRVNHDKNAKTLPQTPQQEKRPYGSGEDLEIAQSLDEVYNLKAKPGFTATEVERKK